MAERGLRASHLTFDVHFTILWMHYDSNTLVWGGVASGIAGLLFMDGFKNGQGPSKKFLSLQVLRLKDGKPCTIKDSFIRRLTSIFQPLDSFWTFGKHQKQVVQALSDLLEHLQQKMMEAEGKKVTVAAQQRNVDAEAHLREMLREAQDNKAFETLAKMEQDATEAASVAKAAAEVDVAYQDARIEHEFLGYAEESSIDKDLAELKAKLQ